LHPEQDTISACKPNATDKVKRKRKNEMKEFIMLKWKINVTRRPEEKLVENI
jgi:hypothetical protein